MKSLAQKRKKTLVLRQSDSAAIPYCNMSSRSHIHYGSLAEVERDRLAKLEAETKQKLESLRAATKGGAPAASAPAAPEPELERKKERKQTTQGRDGRTARRHHTGILRRGV